MTIASLIIDTSTLVWAVIPIRQYRTKLFGYFLIFAVLEVAFLILKNFYYINTYYYYLYGVILLIYPVFYGIKRKYRIWIIVGLIIIGSFLSYLSAKYAILVQLAVHLAILLNFLRYFIINYGESRRINIFNLMLVLYEFSIIPKFFILYSESMAGLAYFYLSTIIEIFIGLFFVFFNEKNSPAIRL
jgi:hypothetical protein